MTYWLEKLKALLLSRRFVAAILAVLVIALEDLFGLTQDQATAVAQILAVWILGDSLNTTSSPGLRKLMKQ